MQMLVSRLQRPSPRKTEAPRRNWAPRFGYVTVAETAGRRRSRSVSLYSWVKSSYYKVKRRLSHHNQAKTLMGSSKNSVPRDCRESSTGWPDDSNRRPPLCWRDGTYADTRWCRLSALPCVGLTRQNHLHTLHPTSMDVDYQRDACKSGVKVGRRATSSTPSPATT